MILNYDLEFQKAAQKLGAVSYWKDEQIPSPDKVHGLVVRLGKTLDKEELSQFPHLRFVATVTTGLDHIDLHYCEDQDIRVFSLKGETEFLNTIKATPEHTWGLLLNLIRNTSQAFDSVKKGHWDRRPFFGTELTGKTIGIIGVGRIGKIIADYAKAFNMKVLGFDRNPDEKEGVEYVDLSTLLESSDVISLHLPLEKQTENFLGFDQFSQMKRCPYFINTARGPIVQDEALLRALQNGQIRGAALDVITGETSFKDNKGESPLIDYAKKHNNLLITPHIAGSTVESMERTAQFIESKILNFLKS